MIGFRSYGNENNGNNGNESNESWGDGYRNLIRSGSGDLSGSGNLSGSDRNLSGSDMNLSGSDRNISGSVNGSVKLNGRDAVCENN